MNLALLFTYFISTYHSLGLLQLSATESVQEPDIAFTLQSTINNAFDTNVFLQKVSHINRIALNFNQTYYTNKQYYKDGGPMIVYIGGEGKLTGRSIERGLIVKLATQLNAIIYGLEHRYYGQSQPFDNLELNNLKYLSAKEAIEDLNYFITKMKIINQKVIIVGGSYAGNLAAWARKLHPETIDMALASSAPVLAKADFYEYDQIVANSFGAQCSNLIVKFTQQLDSILNNNITYFQNIKERFGCLQIQDNVLFLSVLADMLATAVQYNRDGIAFNVNLVCNSLNQNMDFETMVNQMINVTNIYFKSQNKNCYQMSFIEEVQMTKINVDNANRQWTYQTCLEFGYYQSAPTNSISLRSKHLTYDWIYDFTCSSANFGARIGPPKIHEINQYYGGKQLVDKVIYTNGKLDPWSYLSILPSNGRLIEESNNNLLILIESGSHTQDLLSDSVNDANDLKEARQSIMNKLIKWL